MTKPSPERYSAVAVVLHWAMALGIFALIGIGLTMKHGNIPKAQVVQLFQLHKSIGILILLLVIVRLAWRLVQAPPALPSVLPALERKAAHAGHAALYFFMLALPLSGWALVTTSRFNIPTVLFGLVVWPPMPFLADSADKAAIHEVMEAFHKYGAYVLIAVLAVHIGAALRHAVKGDAPLSRMSLFGGKAGGSAK
ncbi:cytochrome b [Rhodoblastus acidophilus]|uniref:Cytochrome b n=1 Tax=Candidatus Rhodoblastus alkanivorans TaxID=2954117 RepID=A0ABS9Z6D1_9HYPH|nr:cytochrome b [Candidatus Rhodoblastus alkanivorans]MCI4679708.1 cytochrome b [Candidatus Rhodoblastus alkanivorans]MCI4683230.1 cytochrome b [Candidatus Rhodoblastus alkanivorans]MDI4640542.1 cytochrome b [Rhodoblastus acidophilus]